MVVRFDSLGRRSRRNLVGISSVAGKLTIVAGDDSGNDRRRSICQNLRLVEGNGSGCLVSPERPRRRRNLARKRRWRRKSEHQNGAAGGDCGGAGGSRGYGSLELRELVTVVAVRRSEGGRSRSDGGPKWWRR